MHTSQHKKDNTQMKTSITVSDLIKAMENARDSMPKNLITNMKIGNWSAFQKYMVISQKQEHMRMMERLP